MYSVETVKEHYATLSDKEIKDLARFKSKGLRKDVLPILKEEIVKRNLNKKMITWVNEETNTLSQTEKEEAIQIIENVSCSNCGKQNGKLTGQEINTLYSFILSTVVKTEILIICGDCGKKKKMKSFLHNLTLGWLSRKGILYVPFYVIMDFLNLIFYQKKISDRILNEFLENFNGRIRQGGINNENLNYLIHLHNRYCSKKPSNSIG